MMARINWRNVFEACVAALLLAGCAAPYQIQPAIPNGGRAVAVSIAPGDATKMVVASASGGIFYSATGGTTWSQTSGNGTFWFNAVKHLPARPGVVLAAASDDTRISSGGGIWRSTDGGANWSRITIATPVPSCASTLSAYGLDAEPARGRAWAATSCGVAYSDDAGATWRFIHAAPGYDNDQAYAVLAPTSSRLVILTDAGVKVSSNAGGSWSWSSAGLPDNILIGAHNQIAVSPFAPAHIFWSFNYRVWDTPNARWIGHAALYRSWDGGASWSSLQDILAMSRPPFVKIARPADRTHYTLHFSDGVCTLENASVTHGATPTLSAWTTARIDHCDPSDMGFESDGRTPLLLTSDAGVHKTADRGASWTLAGAGPAGYAALQVTEVTGQLHPDRSSSDLYFATQDNAIWASRDGGATWPGNRCCEGFYLNIWRAPLPASETKLNGVTCGPCVNFLSSPLLLTQAAFPQPAGSVGNPRLIRPGNYVIGTAIAGLPDISVFELTRDTGATWTPRYAFPEAVRDQARIGGDANPVLYTAIKLSGATPDGTEVVGIKRIADTLASGSPVLSNIAGIGGLGTFATEYAWYTPFGVDPHDSNFLIAPDITSDTVKVSRNAGATWADDTVLAGLVTQGGVFKFHWGQFSQITSFGFDPDCRGHILVGTQQAGIMETFDRGATWSTILDSDFIPAVSSFYFQGRDQVVISSYGRGLWRHAYTCPTRFFPPIDTAVLTEPTIYWKGAKVPFRQIHNPDVCPVCGYFITSGGEIVDFVLDPGTGAVREVVLDKGAIRGFTYERKPVEPPFRVTQALRAGTLGIDAGLRAQLRAGAHIKGLYLDGQQLKGVILAPREVSVEELPRKVALGPYVKVDVKTEDEDDEAGGVQTVVLRGSGFDPRRPIAVSIDGRTVQLDAPRFDQNGNFTVALPPVVGRGKHSVLVEQQGEQGVIRDATTFIIGVEDMVGH
ncbi:sialidase family protein [Massilia sp. R2A-15]|uniref:sialidase family protein n=1 Tax=Massilia sp. R2A-15 TaxID=3064278 RepID=UPI0027354842|nr:sialidase family protein [Massilia sp. R2A-15]WLI90028.1 sialidase family protein [Massilia sp. R2A-15]